MKKTEITFRVELDDQQVPEKIMWKATDGSPKFEKTKTISVNLWDQEKQNTLRIDLWSKDLRVDEMKKFYVDILGGMSQTILSSTGDTFISNKLKTLCEELVTHIDNESKDQKKDIQDLNEDKPIT